MTKYIFPYIELYPWIPVSIGYDNSWFNILAILDSGANISLFSRELGERIGVPIESGFEHEVRGIGGSLVVYKHDLKLKMSQKGEETVLNITADFTKEIKLPFYIIGRENVFNKMNITFDHDKKIMIEII